MIPWQARHWMNG
jgi:hypothetical protein